MSENTPTNSEPQDDAVQGIDAAQQGETVPERPPLPEQSATHAAQSSPEAAPTAPPAPVGAPEHNAGYAAQAPYTAPTAPSAHATSPQAPHTAYPAPSYSGAAFGTSAFGAQPTAAYPAATTRPEHAPSAKLGAGKIVGIMVAAALVGGPQRFKGNIIKRLEMAQESGSVVMKEESIMFHFSLSFWRF